MTTKEIAQTTPGPIWSPELRIALWVAQGLLAVIFGLGGFLRLGLSASAFARTASWPGAVPMMPVRLAGLTELLGAIGLVLPALTRVTPMLTPVAATGLVAVMGYANLFLFWRGDMLMMLINVALGALAAFVDWTRFGKMPVEAR